MAQLKLDNAAVEAPPAGLRGYLAGTADVLKRLLKWILRHPLQAGIIFGVVLLPVLPIVVVQVTLSRRLPKESDKIEVDEAFAALDRGDYPLVTEMVQSLGRDRPLTAEELKAKPFLLGLIADHDASQAANKQQHRLRALAARSLDESRILGFPHGRESEGMYLLGKNLYESGQTEESITVLEAALQLDDQQQTDIHRLLSSAYLNLPEPRFHEALAHNIEYLADQQLSQHDRQRAQLERCRIEFGLEDYAACQRTLDELTPEVAGQSQATIMRALLLEHAARALSEDGVVSIVPEAVDQCRKAIETLERIPRGTADAESSAADTSYLLGRLLLEIGDEATGLAKLAHTQQRWPTTEAGFAAGFAASEHLRRVGREVDAVAAYRDALDALDRETEFRNRWLLLDAVRENALDMYQDCLRQHRFELAIELASACEAIFNRARSLQLQAQAEAQWGRHLLASVTDASSPEGLTQVWQGRRRLRRAGNLYRRLAEIRVATREYPDDLYDAADADLSGHEYTSAVTMFKKYLAVEARKRRPHALLALGEALLAQGRPAEALDSLKECIEFHTRDAALFEARLLASQAYLELGQNALAERLLLDNLDGEALSPTSTEWRDSLFALGRLLYETGRYREAIARLDEATIRYPNVAAAEEARYLAAESYRRSAREVQRQELQEATAEGRLSRRREWEQLLQAGLARYEQELSAILGQQEKHPLTPLEEAILRNCFFARGEILIQLGRYQDAIQAYAGATNRYQQKPEVLQAYVQIAACYRRLGQIAEARSTLEQAKYALKHLAEGMAFDETTNYSQQEWAQLLDTLGTL
jgi:tetratricopeptide (TPR) repeat protein